MRVSVVLRTKAGAGHDPVGTGRLVVIVLSAAALVPARMFAAAPASSVARRVVVRADAEIGVVRPEFYLKELGVPVLRWPGGCYAEPSAAALSVFSRSLLR